MNANEVAILIRAKDEATKTLKDVGDTADKSFGAAEKSAGQFGKTLGDVGKIAGGFVLGQAILNGPSVISGFVGAASDMNETLSKSNTVFGANGREIEKWAAGAARDFGQSKQQALEAAGSFGNMFVQLGIGTDVAADMSMQMVELASDFASFHNADITEVLVAQQAAFRGEYDALQRFVPTINAANVEQKALQMTGKELTSELTQQEKALAVQAIMMENAGAAAGDFDRTSEGLANQQRQLSAEWANAQAQLGTVLMPAMIAIVGFLLNDFAPAVRFLADEVRVQWGKFQPYFEETIKPALENVVAAFEALWPVIGPILNQIAEMVEITVELIVGALDILIKLLSGDFAGAWEASKALLGEYRDYVVETFNNLRDLVVGALTLLRDGAGEIFGGLAESSIEKMSGMKNGLLNAVADIKYGLIEAFQQTKDWIGRVWDGITDVIKAPINAAIGFINRLIGAWNGISFSFPGVDMPGPIPDLPGVSVGTPDIGYIPYLAKGGIVTRPTLAVIGEAGPEAVVPLSRGGAMGTVNHYHINVQALDGTSAAQIIMRELVKWERRGGIAPGTTRAVA